MASYTSFEELDCWQKCRSVKVWVDNFLKTRIPKNDFDMQQNLRRAARSFTRNIAEGFGRYHHKENIQFCLISWASLFEVKDDLLTALDEGIVDDSEITKGMELIQKAIHSVNGYIKYLGSKL